MRMFRAVEHGPAERIEEQGDEHPGEPEERVVEQVKELDHQQVDRERQAEQPQR
ncbi:hypothetical protein [Lapillicoccus sp.]|uniref:hypothetical protein n=1 Tax=Lapillicoccus sp. TaxID=1909287 RepID=UPI003267A3F2